MKLKRVISQRERKEFYAASNLVYRHLPCHRSTEDDVLHLISTGRSAFHQQAQVYPFIIEEEERTVGRFCLIHDHRLKDWVQLSFFEAIDGLAGPYEKILEQAHLLFPEAKRIVVGLNGHLNYGAGLLLNRFNEPPIFGLPYTPSYYPKYFSDLKVHSMVSFRFRTREFFDYKYTKRVKEKIYSTGITTRIMDKGRLKREVSLYTYLNNACFLDHPFWANRSVEEDYELFYPFRFFLKGENLILAEHRGKPIGFLLWYPDFNQLVAGEERLGFSHVLRYRLANPINLFRLTEIAVLPEYRTSLALLAMILHLTSLISKTKYILGEGGFIFEENKSSTHTALRYIERVFGQKPEPYRRFAVFEGLL